MTEILKFSTLILFYGFLGASLTEFILFVLGLNNFKPNPEYEAIFQKIGDWMARTKNKICPFCLSVWGCWVVQFVFIFAFDVKDVFSFEAILKGISFVILSPAVGMYFLLIARKTFEELILIRNSNLTEK